MKLVIDSSVAFKWVVPEVDSDVALRLRDEFLNGAHELIAPSIFPIELAHALTRAERQARVNHSQALQLLTDVLQLGLACTNRSPCCRARWNCLPRCELESTTACTSHWLKLSRANS